MSIEFRKRLGAIAAFLLVISATGLYLHTRENAMSEKVMMYYGDWSPEENRFDASKWFRNDMYRSDIVDGKKSPVTMLRNRPLPFKPSDNDALVAGAIVALEAAEPPVNGDLLGKEWPMLVPRTRYRYSAFEAPDQPQDYYNIYLKYQGERYVITFARNAQTGEIIPGGSVQIMYSESETQIADRQVFKELDDAGIH
ncbi:hypothetical protein ACXR0M_06665 [Pseudomonas sp. Eth.TT006]